MSENGAFVFIRSEIADYVMNNLDKIGRKGIKKELCRCKDADIPEPKFREIGGTVPSLRLDALTALAAGVSRAKAAELISQGLVSLNFEVAESVRFQMSEGDLISVRGFGRTRLERIGNIDEKRQNFCHTFKIRIKRRDFMLTPQDIENKVFKTSFKGYNTEEVDNFLQEVCDSFVELSV